MENAEEEIIKEDEDYDPQVTSNNPTERILARKLRIERRVEALRKQKELKETHEVAGETVTIESEIQKTPVELQVEKSLHLLEKLTLEGEEYITNVRVATEAREANRREREGIGKEKLLKELEEEAEAASEMFHEIADKWCGILKYNDPLHINEDITSQKERCDELIKQKDAIIANLKEKLRKAEIDFGIDQKKQIEDVNSIARRIENQIIIMRKSYREELQMLEDVILAERQLLIEASNKKWDELYKRRDQEEKSNAELRSEDYWNFVKEMANLNRDFEELYRETTIKLENDCDELQRELERIKTDAIMNSEKLDYNYQILKKREDENLIIKSQQKRRINKLQDLINSLRKKNNDYHSQTMLQIEKLTEEVKKLSRSILDVEKKADHIAEVNNVKFKKIWNMNKKRADELFKKILDIDKILYEQQLGLTWKAPEQNLPTMIELESYKNAMVQVKNKTYKSVSSVNEETVSAISEGSPEHQRELDEEQNVIYKRTIRHILNHIADKTGFLIEDQLYAILEPYLEHEQTLVKVDNVFAAFNLKEKSDIDLLLEYFLPYMFCPICNVTLDKTVAIEDESLMHIHDIDQVNLTDLTVNDSKLKMQESSAIEVLKEKAGIGHDHGGTVVDFGPLSVTIYDNNLKGECKGIDKVVDDNKDAESKTSTELRTGMRVPCQYNHPLMISSVYVLKALKEFLAKYHIPKASMPTMATRLTFKRSTVSRLMTPTDIESYWDKYTTLFPEQRVQLWNSLLEGLKKYHALLKARKTVSEEVVDLRQQNLDLRRVFANYIDKKDIPY